MCVSGFKLRVVWLFLEGGIRGFGIDFEGQ